MVEDPVRRTYKRILAVSFIIISSLYIGVDPLTRVPLTRGYFWPEFFWPESHWPEVFWPEDFWPEGSFDQRVYLTRGSIDQRFFWPELLSTRGTQCIIFDQRIKNAFHFAPILCLAIFSPSSLGRGGGISVDKHRLQLQLQLSWKLLLLYYVLQFLWFWNLVKLIKFIRLDKLGYVS